MTDPAEVATARSTGLEYVQVQTSSYSARYQPSAFLHLFQFDARVSSTLSTTQAVVFLGQRHWPDGAPRLVIITGSSGRWGHALEHSSALVLPLRGLFDPLPPDGPRSMGCGTQNIPDPESIWTELKTGVPDPTDSSLISFEVTARTTSGARRTGGGVLYARLQDDDSILFSVRSSYGIEGDMLGEITSLQGASVPMESRGLRSAPISR
ncbi:MAG TPA: hypothetical protein VG711_11300 [Phycisphaerales bacterium]|nr:hypothetical protein [Phycisphaerales bacterium]